MESGGHTSFRSVNDDPTFYRNPCPIDYDGIPWKTPTRDSPGVDIAPEAGMAVIHFPATTPATCGYTDRNVFHAGSPAADTKFICQQFIYSHPVIYDALNIGGVRPDADYKPDLSTTF